VPFAGSGHARRGPGALDGAVRPMTEADVDSAWVGFVAVRWTEEDATPVGEVEMIAVAPSHQRAGIASRLLDRAVAEIAERGVPLAVIGTVLDPGHAPARALYERHGLTGLPLVRYHRPL
jgi:GNAT superfamily N-acetyltransferase